MNKDWCRFCGSLIAVRAAIFALGFQTIGAICQPAFSQNTEAGNTGQSTTLSDVPVFGGPNSVGEALRPGGDGVTDPQYRYDGIQRTFSGWFEFKERLSRDLGLSIGFDYQALSQTVNESLGQKNARSGIFRGYGNWTLIGQGTKNPGSLVFKGETRHRLGSEIAPQFLGLEAGALSITGTLFGDYEERWGLTNLYWQQKLAEGRIGFAVGQLDVTDWLDPYALMNPLTAFQNLSFSTNPTIAAPNQGLGLVVGALLTDNIYVTGSVVDANGDPTSPSFKVFSEKETFKHVEVGLTSGPDRLYFDNIHLTYWQVDEREDAGVPKENGIAVSAAWTFNNQWVPFLRAGWSDGEAALLSQNVSAGVGYLRRNRDLMGIGLSWGKPAASELDEQFTAEAFYRLQFSENFAITGDIQHILDPALNPGEKSITVLGLRGRLSM